MGYYIADLHNKCKPIAGLVIEVMRIYQQGDTFFRCYSCLIIRWRNCNIVNCITTYKAYGTKINRFSDLSTRWPPVTPFRIVRDGILAERLASLYARALKTEPSVTNDQSFAINSIAWKCQNVSSFEVVTNNFPDAINENSCIGSIITLLNAPTSDHWKKTIQDLYKNHHITILFDLLRVLALYCFLVFNLLRFLSFNFQRFIGLKANKTRPSHPKWRFT